MKASSSKLRYADNNDDVIDDHTEVEKTVDDHDLVDVDGENANGVRDEKHLIMRRKVAEGRLFGIISRLFGIISQKCLADTARRL
uniref:Uncharacterized protein n=1 Tax=Tanacetum cinerariifolium TaxID=118510 RepID=A0A699WLZ0_TANCI|nr:hypothetical protein [Tanacetum cinerariifolium]